MSELTTTIQATLDTHRAWHQRLEAEIAQLEAMLSGASTMTVLDELAPTPTPVIPEPAPAARQLPAAAKMRKKKAAPTARGLPPARRSAPQPKRQSAAAVSDLARERAALVFSTIQAHAPIGTTRIMELTGLARHQVQPVLRQLVSDSKVFSKGATSSLVYQPSAAAALAAGISRPDDADHQGTGDRQREQGRNQAALKTQVMVAITKDPGALTEDRLATALGASRDDIADACGALLLDDHITLAADGTYTASTTTQEGGGTLSLTHSTRILQIIESAVLTSRTEVVYQAARHSIDEQTATRTIDQLVAAGQITELDGKLSIDAQQAA